MPRMLTFAYYMWWNASISERLEQLLEQAIFCAALIFALNGRVDTGYFPYPLFLLYGIAPWFYFSEILHKLPGQPGAFRAYLNRNSPISLAPGLAISALPTLLVWMCVCLVASLFYSMPMQGLKFLPYIILCNILSAAGQGLFICAFLPIAGNSTQNGLRIALPFIFWTAPIAWPFTSSSSMLLFLMRLNPLYYVAECSRAMLIDKVFPPTIHTLLFFAIVLGAGIIGLLLMKRTWKLGLAPL
ncbi:hypothetical protein LJC42_01035 [Eubacteriales bacterium OttesenSCG-928-K08]|nr:hypothetical protein [Eubacteriales bacterium OttesenSCG-928-K08]